MRLRLSDDRLLDCTLRPLSSGGFVLSMDDVTKYVRNAELAEKDALTGLANRKALRDRLVERLAGAARTGQATAVLYVDLDRFKAVPGARPGSPGYVAATTILPYPTSL